MIARFFGKKPTNPASELARMGVEKRRKSAREKLVATTAKLCAELGKPLPEPFRQ